MAATTQRVGTQKHEAQASWLRWLGAGGQVGVVARRRDSGPDPGGGDLVLVMLGA